MNVLLVVVVLACFIGASLYKIQKKKRVDLIENKLVELLSKGKYEEFDVALKEAEDNNMISSFHENYLKLNRYIMEDKSQNVDYIVNYFATASLNETQKASVFSKAMTYYVYKDNQRMSALCYKQIQSLKNNADLKETAGLAYRVLVEKKNDDLEFIKKKIAITDGEEKDFYNKLYSEMKKRISNIRCLSDVFVIYT